MGCAILSAMILGLSPPATPGDGGENAALKYWQAFATLPTTTDAELTKLIADCPTMPVDARVRELVAKADYSLDMMRRGAALPRCDWGIDCSEGIYLRLPQGPAARLLASFACLRARMRLEEGRTADALDDILAAMTLARHVSREGGFIVLLVGYAIDQRLIETLAASLPKLPPPALKDLKSRLEALPPFIGQAAVLQECEAKTMDWFIREVKAAKDEQGLLAVLSFVGASEGGAGDAGQAARAFLAECGGNAAGILRFAEAARPSYAAMARKIALPPDEFEKEYQREAGRQAGNPVFKVFFPAIPRCRQAQERADVRRALLAAAVDIQLDGRASPKKQAGAAAGGPFESTAFPGGFELRSRVKGQDGKPLTLTVGRRAR
jgi:hypothetical protein